MLIQTIQIIQRCPMKGREGEREKTRHTMNVCVRGKSSKFLTE